MNIHDGGPVTTVHAHTHTHTQMTGISDWQVATVQMTEPAVHFKGHLKLDVIARVNDENETVMRMRQ